MTLTMENISDFCDLVKELKDDLEKERKKNTILRQTNELLRCEMGNLKTDNQYLISELIMQSLVVGNERKKNVAVREELKSSRTLSNNLQTILDTEFEEYEVLDKKYKSVCSRLLLHGKKQKEKSIQTEYRGRETTDKETQTITTTPCSLVTSIGISETEKTLTVVESRIIRKNSRIKKSIMINRIIQTDTVTVSKESQTDIIIKNHEYKPNVTTNNCEKKYTPNKFPKRKNHSNSKKRMTISGYDLKHRSKSLYKKKDIIYIY